MRAKTLKLTGLAAAVLSTAGLAAMFTMTPAQARGPGESHVVATPSFDPALAKKAGFPATAMNVNRTADGHMSWMMTKADIQKQENFNRNYMAPARAQFAAKLTDDGSKVTSSMLFGITDTSTYMVSPLDFEGLYNTTKLYKSGSAMAVLLGEGDDEVNAPIQLPAGAIVTGMTAYGSDSSSLDDPDFYLYRYCPGGTYNGSGTAPQAHVTSGFNGGTYAVDSSTSNLVIDNSDCTYYVQADTSEGTTDTNQWVYGVALRWKRQISPDPATSTFTDVGSGAPFHREIEALAASGITGGCGSGKFCPDVAVTRGQMAAYLARALGLHWESN